MLLGIIFTLIKLIAFGLLLLFLLFALTTSIFALIGVLFPQRRALICTRLLGLAIANQPREMFNLYSDEYKKTTSIQEVVFLASRIHLTIPPNVKTHWKTIQKEYKHEVFQTVLKGKDDKQHSLMIHIRRKNQRWKISEVEFIDYHFNDSNIGTV